MVVSKVKKYVCQAAVEARKTLVISSNENPSNYNEAGTDDRFGDFSTRGGKTTTTLCEDRMETRILGISADSDVYQSTLHILILEVVLSVPQPDQNVYIFCY